MIPGNRCITLEGGHGCGNKVCINETELIDGTAVFRYNAMQSCLMVCSWFSLVTLKCENSKWKEKIGLIFFFLKKNGMPNIGIYMKESGLDFLVLNFISVRSNSTWYPIFLSCCDMWVVSEAETTWKVGDDLRRQGLLHISKLEHCVLRVVLERGFAKLNAEESWKLEWTGVIWALMDSGSELEGRAART